MEFYKAWAIFTIFVSTISIAFCENSTLSSAMLSCEVNYLGKIKFKIHLPNGIQRNQLTGFYYLDENIPTWTKFKNCYIPSDENISDAYICDVPLLTHPDYSNITLRFSLNFTSDISTMSITNFYFYPQRPHMKIKSVVPWITSQKFTQCKYSFGPKIMGLQEERKQINISWIEYPLSFQYRFMHNRTTIEVRNTETSHMIVKKRRQDVCIQDKCKYAVNVDQCSEYEICVATTFSQGGIQRKCKSLRVHCTTSEERNSRKWREVLLVLFGGILILACLAMSASLFYKYVTRRKIEKGELELVVPRTSEPEHNYSYPALYITNGESFHDDEA